MKHLLRDHLFGILAFVISFSFTLYLYQDARTSAMQRNADLFTYRTNLAKSAIERRMNHYVQVLKGARAYFSAADSVTRDEWRLYVNSLELDVNYPGIQGVGYGIYFKHEELPHHLAQIRSEGFPDYQITPAGDRPEYTAIIYLEPFSGRNKRAFGFDMMSEPIRRKAMEKARDTGLAAMTGKVTLKQETDDDKQPGFLIYLPIYKTRNELKTENERRQQLEGFVYTPFRTKDLISSTLGQTYDDLGIEIYDGENPTQESILFDSDTVNEFSVFRNQTILSRKVEVIMAGRPWQIHFKALPEFGTLFDKYISAIILTVGTIISLLLYFALWSLAKLRKANRINQTITDNASAAMFMLNTDGYCTFINPAAEQMTGYTLPEIRQRTFREMVHPDAQNRNRSSSDWPIDQAVTLQKDIRLYEDTFKDKQGRLFPVLCSAKPVFHNGLPTATVVEVRDITEQKAAEQQIKQNAQFLQKIFYEVPAKVAIVRAPDEKYILANAKYRALFDNRELLGKNLEEAHPELKHQGFFEKMNQVFVTGEPFIGKQLEVKINQPGDHKPSRYFDLVFQPIKNDKDLVEAVIIFAVEVTELVHNRRKLVTINEELSSKNRELIRTNTDLDNFIYTASHDLKSPITNLESLTKYLNESLTEKLSDEDRSLLEMISTSVNKLKRTIADLAEITKVQKETEEPVEPVRFGDVLDDIIFDLNPMIDEAKAIVNYNFQAEEMIFARKNLRSIIYNLLTNAIKYRSPSRRPVVNISTIQEKDQIVLIVEDNGLGLKPEHKEKLFVMFKRLHSHVEGTGIGLYIIKRIIENYGGRISVTSELDKGTTFTVYLPQKEKLADVLVQKT